MRLFVKLSYWQFILVSTIPWVVTLIIIAIGLYKMPGDPMPYLLFLVFKSAAVCIFLKAIIECGWWWSVATALHDKFPDLVGNNIHRIRRWVLILFCTYMPFAIALFSNLIFYIFDLTIIGICIVGILIVMIIISGINLRSFLVGTLNQIARKYYNQDIDPFNFSLLNPVSSWSIQKMIYELFKTDHD